MAKATFAAGCFWGIEANFRALPGVTSATVGYIGGHTDNPTYQDVCTDRTGHAEAVEVEYDPTKITYDALLDAFWAMHDPTTPNRQGPDVGTQYRSAIFYHDAEQEAAAQVSRDRLAKSGKFRRPIVTEIVPAGTFIAARNITSATTKSTTCTAAESRLDRSSTPAKSSVQRIDRQSTANARSSKSCYKLASPLVRSRIRGIEPLLVAIGAGLQLPLIWKPSST